MITDILRGDARTIKRHQKAMRSVQGYRAWQQHASAVDALDGQQDWRENPQSDDYHFELIRRRLDRIRALRQRGDVSGLIYLLDEGLHRNTGNIANPALFRQARSGTKLLIDEYVDEVCDALNWLCDAEQDGFSFSDKYKFFRRTGQSFGRSALLLSGGATMGLFHIGVVAALWEQNLLPRVFSGSSAGAIVAGVLGTHNDHELMHTLNPANMQRNAFQRLSLANMLSTRSVLSSQNLRECIEDNVGDLSFEEAFEKTGRIINISVSPYEENQTPRLMNYLSTPHVTVSSAVLASCSVPGIFEPVTLMEKKRNGRIAAWNASRKWMDGSVRADLPMLRLSRLHNVNHYIVSQTNPHIVPFVNRNPGIKSVSSFTRDLVKTSALAQVRGFLEVSNRHVSAPIIRRVMQEALSISAQRYTGDINIYAPFRVDRYFKLFSNPSVEELIEHAMDGQRATWPKMEMIRIHTRVSKTFEDCIDRLKHESGRSSHVLESDAAA